MLTSPPPPALTEQHDTSDAALAEILEGLSRAQKMLPPKLFYDERGSALFEEITRLPEYYLTRAELEIMERHIRAIVARLGPRVSLIEFGSGASRKTRLLLEHLVEPAAYVPVDISRDYLVQVAAELADALPSVEILPVAADFTHPFELPAPAVTPRRNVVYFPGSTLGNFPDEAAASLLEVMHHEAGPGGGLLIGADLVKDRRVLEPAYNDRAGVTAAFNLNLLRRLSSEFAADIDIDAFRHEAVYDEAHERIEMYLVSTRPQAFTIAGRTFSVQEGERILTEYSQKYTLEGFARLAERAGFRVAELWTDRNEWFSVQYCERL